MRFNIFETVTDPKVIVTSPGKGDATNYNVETMVGKFHRVIPLTAKEISALRLMDHQVDKFAPASGSGVMVSVQALEKFTTEY